MELPSSPKWNTCPLCWTLQMRSWLWDLKVASRWLIILVWKCCVRSGCDGDSPFLNPAVLTVHVASRWRTVRGSHNLLSPQRRPCFRCCASNGLSGSELFFFFFRVIVSGEKCQFDGKYGAVVPAKPQTPGRTVRSASSAEKHHSSNHLWHKPVSELKCFCLVFLLFFGLVFALLWAWLCRVCCSPRRS